MTDPPEEPIAGTSAASEEWDDPPTVALGIKKRRNRELLADALSAYDTVTVRDRIDDGTDLCIVDPGGFDDLSGALRRWKRDQRPAAAPALLLANAPETAIWREYADAMGERLDAVQSIPVPKRAIVSQVRGLLETRRHSLAAKRRHEQLELYRRAMDGANVGITVADASDPELPLVYANDGFDEITGYDRSESLGRNCRFLQGERTDGDTVDRIREALAADEPVSVEILNYRKSGEPFWNDLDIMPVTDDSGDVTHFLGFHEDVTERQRRQSDLERYEQVIQSIDDPIVVADDRGRVELSNEAAAGLFGEDDGVPADSSVPSLFPADARDAVEAAIEALRRSGDPQERELTLPDHGGRRRIYQFRFQPERSTPGKPLSRTIVIGRDITTLREYQNRLSVLDRVLRHNLRNKLAIIAGNTDVLSDAGDDMSAATIAEVVADIDEAVEDLLDLADAARQFNRSVQPGDRSGSPIPLGKLLEETVAAARRRYPNASIRIDVTDATTAICPATIRLCVDQVIENAVEYTDAPEPTVELVVVDCPAEGYTEIHISDEGPGMPQREREALQRGAETALEHLQGISLWLVSWAVRGVGGDLMIRDDDPTGTTVILRLPRAGD